MPKNESDIGKQLGGGGKIEIGKYKTSKWTRKNYLTAISLLAIPYSTMLFALYTSGLVFLSGILLGVTIVCALLVGLVYWLDKADF